MSKDITAYVGATIWMGLSMGTFISRGNLIDYLGIPDDRPLSRGHSHLYSFRHHNLTPKMFDSFRELVSQDVSVCPFYTQVAEAASLIQIDISGATRFCGMIDPAAANPLATDAKLPFKACCFVAWAITKCLLALWMTDKTAEDLRRKQQAIHEEISQRYPGNPDEIPFKVFMGQESIPLDVLALSAHEGITYLKAEDVANIEKGVRTVWPNCQLRGKELAKAIYFNLYLPFVNEIIGFGEPQCPRAPDVLEPALRIESDRLNVWQIACFH